MLNVAHVEFAETEREFTETLFRHGRATPAGIAKRSKRAIHLYRPNGELVGVVSSGGVIGAATTLPDGRKWYSYGDCPLIGELSLTAARDAIECLAVGREWVRGEVRYSFK